jgi:hypothetical protein
MKVPIAAVALNVVFLLSGISVCQNQPLKPARESSVDTGASLITNGNFSSSLQSWYTVGEGTNRFHPEDPGRAKFTVQNGILQIDIHDQGNTIWSVMLYQSAQFEKGANYTVSFRAKADFEPHITANVSQDVTYTNFSGDRKFKLTNAMQHYSYSFTMNEQGPALVQFCLGHTGKGKIYLTDIAVTRTQQPL